VRLVENGCTLDASSDFDAWMECNGLKTVQVDRSHDIFHDASPDTWNDVSAGLSGDLTCVSSGTDTQLNSSPDTLPDESG
ncbi:unnamed protein product, partial [Didymodactylos carnosus]